MVIVTMEKHEVETGTRECACVEGKSRTKSRGLTEDKFEKALRRLKVSHVLIWRKNSLGKGTCKCKATTVAREYPQEQWWPRLAGVDGYGVGELVGDEIRGATKNIMQVLRGHCKNTGFYFLVGQSHDLTPF